MVDFLLSIAEFAIKTLLIGGVFGILAIFIASLIRRGPGTDLGQITIFNLNGHYEDLRAALRQATMREKDYKALVKKERKQTKDEEDGEKRRVFLIDFHGDIAATSTSELREQVSALIDIREEGDEVVVRVESHGGMMHEYGLAAAQLVRLREAGMKLTVCVDKVAASGGYMMACCGDQILAAPFAILGSVGVLLQMANFNKLLRKYDVEMLELTAGEYKTTVSPMGEITEKGKAKSLEDLALAHTLFKDFLKGQRPQLDVESIATGEIWYGAQAVEMKLIDGLTTSDDYLRKCVKEARLFKVEYEVAKSVKERLAGVLGMATEKAFTRLWSRMEERAQPRS